MLKLTKNSAEECLILTRQQARLECQGSSSSTELIKTTVNRNKITANNEIDSVSEEDEDINYPIEHELSKGENQNHDDDEKERTLRTLVYTSSNGLPLESHCSHDTHFLSTTVS